MDLLDFVRVLTWPPCAPELAELRQRYEGVLADRFGAFLGRLTKERPTAAHGILTLYRQLPDAALMRFLCAPETSHRLLWGTRRDPSDLPRYVSDALTAELHRSGATVPLPEMCWTALGDYVAIPGEPPGARGEQRPSSALTIDFDSPNAHYMRSPRDTNAPLSASPAMPAPRAHGAERLLTTAEREMVLGLLDRALTGIAETSATAHSFVVTNNLSVVVLLSPETNSDFSSSSPEKFLGATVLWMGRSRSGDEVDIADALIHEAVHSVLDTHEFLAASDEARRWLRNPSFYDGRDRTVSPWTGNPLALLTFLHACFVWFAEVQFWTRALATGAFDRTRSMARLVKASKGFLQGPLTDQLDAFSDEIHPSLYESVCTMQRTVSQAFLAKGTDQ